MTWRRNGQTIILYLNTGSSCSGGSWRMKGERAGRSTHKFTSYRNHILLVEPSCNAFLPSCHCLAIYEGFLKVIRVSKFCPGSVTEWRYDCW
ncbi:hypothetical protein PLICRDRAFT_643841 [Plicaturopsis crispa FD-325 SS-3]|nr:hypothetical protein PLICRDRAFT_643841 [Plicaturopsis crispa FD-325 SS-3]